MTILVIIPARNEQSRVGAVVDQARALGYPVLVIDDGSDDDTGAEARAAGAHVVRHRFACGYGASLETGFHYALRKHFAGVVTLDGDGQHDPAAIPEFVKTLEEKKADVVLGSRVLGRRDGMAGDEASAGRRLGQALLRRIATWMAHTEITDPTTGYLALTRRALEFLVAGRFPHDYPDADVLVMMIRSGFTVAEIPIAVFARSGGRSMHGGWRPLYYALKMSLALLMTPLRKEEAPHYS